MTNIGGAHTDEQAIRLTRRGLRLAQFTVAYNVVEGVVAVTAGLIAGLVSVVGFGFDSAIESIAAVLVAIRLSARLRHGVADERKERLTLRHGRHVILHPCRLRHSRRHPQSHRR